jgi:hypothetical protein
MTGMNRQLLAERASRKTPQGRRVRALFNAFLSRLGSGPHDHVIQAGAMRAAELLVLCEDLRARALAGEGIGVNDITRLESTARRAEADLFGKVEPPDPQLDLPEYPENPAESQDGDDE